MMYHLNQLRKYFLGELLHLANSAPPLWRKEFYEIKDQILHAHGTTEGMHLQHIRKDCYACNGSGKLYEERVHLGLLTPIFKGKCRRCGGSGVFQEFWVALGYWRLGNRYFHIPNTRLDAEGLERWKNVQFSQHIEGYIRHEHPKFYLNAEAAYWLSLFYNFPLFCARFGHTGHPSRKFTPMVILSTLIFDIGRIPIFIRNKVSLWTYRFKSYRMLHCKHEFPWAEEPSAWDECKKCHVERYYVEHNREEIPF